MSLHRLGVAGGQQFCVAWASAMLRPKLSVAVAIAAPSEEARAELLNLMKP